MSPVPRTAVRLVWLSALSGIVGAAPAIAARPATTVAVIRAVPRIAVGSGHSANGGGRGRVEVATRASKAPALPPSTRPTDASTYASVALRNAGGSGGSPQSGPAPWPAPSGGARVVRLASRSDVRHASASAGLFHEAHAPPAPATAVAGRLA